MYVYQTYEKRKKKFNFFYIILTFIAGFGGAFFAQSYLKDIIGKNNENDITKLSYETPYFKEEKYQQINNEDMIETVMNSVVGISKLQANEESLFDISLSKKWRIRYWHCSI